MLFGLLISTENETIIKFLDFFPVVKNIWNMIAPIASQPNQSTALAFATQVSILFMRGVFYT